MDKTTKQAVSRDGDGGQRDETEFKPEGMSANVKPKKTARDGDGGQRDETGPKSDGMAVSG